MTRLGAVALIALCGCAGSPAREPRPGSVDETAWGDEYAGVDDDADVQAVLAGAARTSGRTSAGVTSPAITSTALLGPYLSRNHCLTSARLAASRSAIDPMVVW